MTFWISRCFLLSSRVLVRYRGLGPYMQRFVGEFPSAQPSPITYPFTFTIIFSPWARSAAIAVINFFKL